MKKEYLKKVIRKMAKTVAINSVGRSFPLTVHEPKLPKKLADKK